MIRAFTQKRVCFSEVTNNCLRPIYNPIKNKPAVCQKRPAPKPNINWLSDQRSYSYPKTPTSSPLWYIPPLLYTSRPLPNRAKYEKDQTDLLYNDTTQRAAIKQNSRNKYGTVTPLAHHEQYDSHYREQQQHISCRKKSCIQRSKSYQ